jgi:hypothetical protein
MTEAAAINAVCLVSDVGPYSRFCALNKDLSFLLCRTPRDWQEKIRTLVLDDAFRKDMAWRIRRTAEEHFEQRKLMILWKQAFDSVLA